MPRPDDAELRLVGEAVRALRRGPGGQGSAAAVRTASGQVVTALALADAVCAEAAALSAALSRGERVVTLAAVRHVSADATRVTAPCVGCRRLLRAYAPAVRVLHLGDGLQVSGLDALPGP